MKAEYEDGVAQEHGELERDQRRPACPAVNERSSEREVDHDQRQHTDVGRG